MATLSTAHATSTLTPPSSSHGRDHSAWESEDYQDKSVLSNDHHEASYMSGQTDGDNSRRKPYPVSINVKQDRENGLRSPIMADDGTFGEARPVAASRAQSRASERRPRERNTDNSATSPATEEDKWIHRDKLAKIENAELQAAGFVLPKPRAASRRRDRSEHGHRHDKSSRKNSMASDNRPVDIEVPEWDLRLPEEIMEENDSNYWESPLNNGKGSRIPVAKVSPAPIPNDFLDRDVPIGRSKSFDPDADTTRKPRSRSGSTKTNHENYQTSSSVPPTSRRGIGESPRKASATRKSVPPRRSLSRPKTWNNRDSIGTQPSTRSGEYTLSNNNGGTSSNKQPEGDPPWMISSYQPDPRLPPEEQLLPTVARRLQQEKWEKEGKFGNVFDKDFRPLNDEGFLKLPEPAAKSGTEPEGESEEQEEKHEDQWPLRSTDIPRSPTVRSNYSTIPKISDKPPGSPVLGGRVNGQTMSRPGTAQTHQEPQAQTQELLQQQRQQQQQQQHQEKEQEQAPAELEKSKEADCVCCVVM